LQRTTTDTNCRTKLMRHQPNKVFIRVRCMRVNGYNKFISQFQDDRHQPTQLSIWISLKTTSDPSEVSITVLSASHHYSQEKTATSSFGQILSSARAARYLSAVTPKSKINGHGHDMTQTDGNQLATDSDILFSYLFYMCTKV
jgi:hypothetical protein